MKPATQVACSLAAELVLEISKPVSRPASQFYFDEELDWQSWSLNLDARRNLTEKLSPFS